ncbi:MAG: aldo/keto reductase family protein [candidate division Zixibacteria bacterium]|nr:aldo/keto reductase family protein [candidate division Zixibacteria bacterium]
MNYRRVGRTGLKISEISLGAWLTYGGTVDQKRADKIIHRAVELGVNFIDISDIYARGSAEKVVGQAIAEMKRTDLVISSKLFWPMSDNPNDRGLSRKHIMESIRKSLSRIGIDYLDIYFCHRFDPETPIEETVRAMEDLVRAGDILYWGTSVWEPDQIDDAVTSAVRWHGYPPSVEQPKYHMLDRHIEDAIIPTCERHGMGLTVWSPLAQGLLTGKYNSGAPKDSRGATSKWMERDLTPENIAVARKLTDLAKELGISVSQLALAWVLRLPQISCAITGATSVEQLEENVAASGIALDSGALDKIDQIIG